MKVSNYVATSEMLTLQCWQLMWTMCKTLLPYEFSCCTRPVVRLFTFISCSISYLYNLLIFQIVKYKFSFLLNKSLVYQYSIVTTLDS